MLAGGDWPVSPGKSAFCGASRTSRPCWRARCRFRRHHRHVGRIGGRGPTQQRAEPRRAGRPPDQGRLREIDLNVDIEDITELFLNAPRTPTRRRREVAAIGEVALDEDRVRGGPARSSPSGCRRTTSRPRLANHRDRHRNRRAGGIQPEIRGRAGRRRRRRLRRSWRMAAGDDRRTAIHGRRRRQHHEPETGHRLRTTSCLVPSARGCRRRSSWTVLEVDGFLGRALGVFADADSLAAFGPNPLDPACRKPPVPGVRRDAESQPRSQSSSPLIRRPGP